MAVLAIHISVTNAAAHARRHGHPDDLAAYGHRISPWSLRVIVHQTCRLGNAPADRWSKSITFVVAACKVAARDPDGVAMPDGGKLLTLAAATASTKVKKKSNENNM